MRVHVTVVAPSLPGAEAVIRSVVSTVWAGEGIFIDWSSTGRPIALQDVDAWILARDGETVSSSPYALGAASFVEDEPRRVVRLSI